MRKASVLDNKILFGLVATSLIIGVLLLWLQVNNAIGFTIIALLLVVLAIVPLLFFKPLYGIIAFLITRNLVDIYSSVSFYLGPIELNLASLMGLLIVPWGLFCIVRSYQPLSSIQRIPLLVPWMLFFLISFISIAHSFSVNESLVHILRLIDFFLIYVVTYTYVTHHKEGMLINGGILVSLITPILLALWQKITHTGLDSGDIANRVFGTFVHPNILAYILMISIGICLILWNQVKTTYLKIMIFVFGLIAFGTLTLTFTRGAWIGVLILCSVWLLSKPKLFTSALVTVFLLYSTYSFLGPHILNSLSIQQTQYPLVQRLQVDNNEETSSVLWRMRTWQETIPAFYEHPWTGSGIGSFEHVRTRFISYESDLTALEAHNDYLRLLIETGAVGVVLYILLYITILRQALRSYKILSPIQKPYALGLAAITVSMLLMSFGDNMLRNVPLQWIFWSVVGTSLSLCTINEKGYEY